MGKPSIFSKEYERRMRKRKLRIAFAVLIFVILGFGVLYKGYISNFIKSAKASYINEKQKQAEDKQKQELSNKEENKIAEDKKVEEKNVVEEKFYDIPIKEGVKVKVVYDETQGEKKFKYVEPSESKINFDINSTGKGLVIHDESAQSMIFCDINGNYKDITMPAFNSSSANRSFSKESVIAENPAYVWAASPKFFNENQIVYISQLPWFGKEEKYIWVVDASNSTYRNTNVYGKNVVVGNKVDKGIEINIDGKISYMDQNGNLIQ